MRMYDIIKKKRDGLELSCEEINYFIKGLVNGSIPDYQASALCMAIYFKGMNYRETEDLTFAVRDSGDKLNFSGMKGIRVDKHSTGGVGDKTSLVVAPIVASYGVKIAKMSGKGLGHTGGTIDKLESIPNFRTDLTEKEFISVVEKIGICIVGQSATLAPADKKLYALRDVTATVDSLPLVVSSIMGKKLTADDHCIVLDVKTGSGAFTKTIEQSRELAEIMVKIGKKAGKKMLAMITDMDRPLGNAIGNALEVDEAIETLKGNGPQDLTELCIELSASMLFLAEKGSKKECLQLAKKAILSGKALDTLAQMVEMQGSEKAYIYGEKVIPKAPYTYEVRAEKDGFIWHVDTEGYGEASLMLGAGRNTKEESIDYGAGIVLQVKTGDYVKCGQVMATFYSSDKQKFLMAKKVFLESTDIRVEKPKERPLILGIVE